ncbi:hypothetical protein EVAR_22804_1 [Eumeta japonica]|uniref:Uncharacterized protein n=1 Tax=Eumeta variegata TaxID=151549 RepID=A0A4C1VHC5_EUMVA|nr:hypothetical protein EVAR_22804_1 [Eumeta japonica]
MHWRGGVVIEREGMRERKERGGKRKVLTCELRTNLLVCKGPRADPAFESRGSHMRGSARTGSHSITIERQRHGPVWVMTLHNPSRPMDPPLLLRYKRARKQPKQMGIATQVNSIPAAPGESLVYRWPFQKDRRFSSLELLVRMGRRSGRRSPSVDARPSSRYRSNRFEFTELACSNKYRYGRTSGHYLSAESQPAISLVMVIGGRAVRAEHRNA